MIIRIQHSTATFKIRFTNHKIDFEKQKGMENRGRHYYERAPTLLSENKMLTVLKLDISDA